MSGYADEPTCELGFWKPMHAGCPKCGPNGPCVDPDYEALIQATAEKDRFRRVLLRVCLVIGLAALLALLTSCGGAGTAPDEFRLRPVPYPAIPAPGPDGYTDAQNAGVLAAYDAALTEANARLCWLAAYWNKRPEGCRVE